MPAERLTMRKLKEIFKLKWCDGLSPERIARSVGCGRTSVREYLERASQAGITNYHRFWPWMRRSSSEGSLPRHGGSAGCALRRARVRFRSGRRSTKSVPAPVSLSSFFGTGS